LRFFFFYFKRKTGVAVKGNVKKDSTNLDDLDDFWADEESTRKLQLSYHADDLFPHHDAPFDLHQSYDDQGDDRPTGGPDEAPTTTVRSSVSPRGARKVGASPGKPRKDKLEELEKVLGITSSSSTTAVPLGGESGAEAVGESPGKAGGRGGDESRKRKSVSFHDSTTMELQQSPSKSSLALS